MCKVCSHPARDQVAEDLRKKAAGDKGITFGKLGQKYGIPKQNLHHFSVSCLPYLTAGVDRPRKRKGPGEDGKPAAPKGKAEDSAEDLAAAVEILVTEETPDVEALDRLKAEAFRRLSYAKERSFVSLARLCREILETLVKARQAVAPSGDEDSERNADDVNARLDEQIERLRGAVPRPTTAAEVTDDG